jgi:hypothetical protein
MLVEWFDTAMCSVCGDQASSHDNVMATHIATNVRAIAGHFNVCAKDVCVLAIKEEIESRLGFLDTEGFAWFHEDGGVIDWNAFVSNPH